MSKLAPPTQLFIRRGITLAPNLFKSKSSQGGKNATCSKPEPKTTEPASKPKPTPKFPKSNLWRAITFLVVFPALGYIAYDVRKQLESQPERERPEFVPYTYLRLRNKRYPWGDGQRTFFHNPKVNPLPGGYEDDDGGDEQPPPAKE